MKKWKKGAWPGRSKGAAADTFAKVGARGTRLRGREARSDETYNHGGMRATRYARRYALLNRTLRAPLNCNTLFSISSPHLLWRLLSFSTFFFFVFFFFFISHGSSLAQCSARSLSRNHAFENGIVFCIELPSFLAFFSFLCLSLHETGPFLK